MVSCALSAPQLALEKGGERGGFGQDITTTPTLHLEQKFFCSPGLLEVQFVLASEFVFASHNAFRFSIWDLVD